MQSSKRLFNFLFFSVSFAFIALNAYYLTKDIYVVNFLPLILLFVLTGIFAMDKLLLMVVFFTPLSLTLSELYNSKINTDLSMPTEPLLFGMLLLFILKILNGYRIDPKIVRHPISIAIVANLTWIAFTAFTSTLPMVSFKFLVARLWFVIPGYFITTQVFRDKKNIRRFLWLYILPLMIVVFYTLTEHSKFDFAEHPANWVVKPFYNDHTSYGAMLAMFIPVLIGFFFLKSYNGLIKFLSLLILGVFLIGTVLSYTRAAWVSLAVALALLILLILKIRFRTIMVFIVILMGIFFLNQEKIMMALEKNNQDSSDNLAEHVESISNISTDASNKERLNRWNCAFRMFETKPILGYGPGTYSFKYGPFQVLKDKTIISTNHGDAGNAHSEYIGPLAESGILGSMSFITILVLVLSTGMKLYFNLKDKGLRVLACSVLLGLMTYFVHGFMNNFLDTDKASVPFWGFIAMLTAIDVYHSGNSTNEPSQLTLPEPATE